MMRPPVLTLQLQPHFKWVAQADIDDGERPGVTSAEAARIKQLEQENRELTTKLPGTPT